MSIFKPCVVPAVSSSSSSNNSGRGLLTLSSPSALLCSPPHQRIHLSACWTRWTRFLRCSSLTTWFFLVFFWIPLRVRKADVQNGGRMSHQVYYQPANRASLHQSVLGISVSMGFFVSLHSTCNNQGCAAPIQARWATVASAPRFPRSNKPWPSRCPMVGK